MARVQEPTGAQDFVRAAAEIGALEELHVLCREIADAYGFEFYCYGAALPSSLLKPYMLLLDGYPEAWRERYVQQGYLAADPVVEHSQHSVVPLPWDELGERIAQDDLARKIFAEAAEFGLRSGVTLPMRGVHGDFSLWSLSSSEAPEVAYSRIRAILPDLCLLALHLHEALDRLVESGVLEYVRPQLTARESECLLWAAEGKTAWETSQILGIAERTVIFHLQNAAEKLGCSNRQQAIARAIAQGLVCASSQAMRL